jgi:hypothetical protein
VRSLFVPGQAHDLKTPLHSIMAEIEHLKSTIDQVVEAFGADSGAEGGLAAAGASAKDFAAASFHTLSSIKKLASSSSESFESLDTTCKFLIMAINRSQDYVKASSGISLTPILETFNVKDVLNIVHKCMINTKCGRIINVHPLNDVCPFLITDR